MSRIGVFLGFQPGVRLTTEGIGRLLAFILKENNDNKIVIICPAWLIDSIDVLLEDNKIPKGKFEILCTKRVPIGVKFKMIMQRKNRKLKTKSKFSVFLSKFKSKLINLIENKIASYLSTGAIISLILKTIVYMLIGLLLLPFTLIFLLSFLLYKISNKIIKVVRRKVIGFSLGNPILQKIKLYAKSGQHIIYQIVIDNEISRLVKLVNEKKDISSCFIPSMIWPQINNLNCYKILAAPDIVFYDFPTQFPGVETTHRKIRQSIEAADHLISYSDFVKNEHLVNKCGVDKSKITVIKHANVDMSEHLKLTKSVKKYYSMKSNAKDIINKYIADKYNPNHVLYDCDIENLDYIIFSSQQRPHKNILNLVKAIKIVNNDMYSNIKLVLTGDISEVAYIQNYIRDNHLENDVFVMHGLSSKVLAAFNKMAACAVNPTLFEGGFPFTFSEAYSVGTPSIMSKIPVVSAEIENSELQEMMLFDPFNPYEIADKIVWALENRQKLFEAQDSLYRQFDQRDWKKVAGEYNQVFRKFMS
ncbi:glycosyltransferase [Paenibacillus sp. FJAT-27812]|uniref:glycosyltransferase n=1 Tax=Paenibacillus sp. FJAT-27812 TaxID=1684143 RepID=UPI0006A78FA6|nr:glycosyltransferase [Paenibacillus sp. FJAT-27812]